MADEKSVGKSGLAYFWGQLKLLLADFCTKAEVEELISGDFNCGEFTDTTSGDDYDCGLF